MHIRFFRRVYGWERIVEYGRTIGEILYVNRTAKTLVCFAALVAFSAIAALIAVAVLAKQKREGPEQERHALESLGMVLNHMRDAEGVSVLKDWNQLLTHSLWPTVDSKWKSATKIQDRYVIVHDLGITEPGERGDWVLLRRIPIDVSKSGVRFVVGDATNKLSGEAFSRIAVFQINESDFSSVTNELRRSRPDVYRELVQRLAGRL